MTDEEKKYPEARSYSYDELLVRIIELENELSRFKIKNEEALTREDFDKALIDNNLHVVHLYIDLLESQLSRYEAEKKELQALVDLFRVRANNNESLDEVMRRAEIHTFTPYDSYGEPEESAIGIEELQQIITDVKEGK